jgi:hypothetical protein
MASELFRNIGTEISINPTMISWIYYNLIGKILPTSQSNADKTQFKKCDNGVCAQITLRNEPIVLKWNSVINHMFIPPCKSQQYDPTLHQI